MLYPLLRSFVKLGLNWYVTDWQVKNLNFVNLKDPALIVSNHPNSFFDALVIAVHAPADIRFLARGDAFKKPVANWFLRSLFMLPIYKKNDDEDAQIKNAFTIDACVKELMKGNKVLIFPEGVSRNKFDLQPFMYAGTSMLVERAIQMDVPLQIQPYALGYSSFDDVPKAVSVEGMSALDCTNYLTGPNQVNTAQILMDLSDKIAFNLPTDFIRPRPDIQKTRAWMRIPAQLGYYAHHWFYQLVKKQVKKRSEGTIFFDSLLFGILLFSYPILVFLFSILIGNLVGFWTGLIVFLLLPFLSYCWVQYQQPKQGQEVDSDRKNRLNIE